MTANIRLCLGICLRATKTGGRAAAKARVKGLQMGVKTETPAKVNPARLAQAAQAVIKGRSLIQAQPPAPPQHPHPPVEQWLGWWSPSTKPGLTFEQRRALALITALIAEVFPESSWMMG